VRVDLRGNIKGVGPVFLTYAKGVRGRALIRRTVAVEDDAPWRRGSGWGVLLVPGVVLTVGTWRPDANPNTVVEAREAMEHAPDIHRWSVVATLSLGERPADDWTIIPMEKSA
jgi:hypothetical protein